MKKIPIVLATALTCAASAQENDGPRPPWEIGKTPPKWAQEYILQQEQSSWWLSGWRVSAGANFGFGMKTRMSRISPVSWHAAQTSPNVGSPADIGNSLAAGNEVRFLNGAYINPNGSMQNSTFTQNWNVPASALDKSTGTITLDSAQVDPASTRAGGSDDSDANGVSLELSKMLYADKSGFGLDFAFGISWLKADNCFKMRRSGNQFSRTRYSYTPSPGNMNANTLTADFLTPTDGYYGSGGAPGIGAVLDWSDFGADTITASTENYRYSMDASGDYEEWEFSFILKPWYEVTDWLRVNANAGLGITRSEFEYSVHSSINGAGSHSYHGSESEWRTYGIAGGGVLARVGMFDISCDILARLGQKDMDIDGQAIHGKVEKPNVFVRVAVGFEF